jgi:hypothetical protein
MKKLFSFHFDTDLKSKVVKYAADRGISVAEAIHKALTKLLKDEKANH